MAVGEGLLQAVGDLASERPEDIAPLGGDFHVRIFGEFTRDKRIRAVRQYGQHNATERSQQDGVGSC